MAKPSASKPGASKAASKPGASKGARKAPAEPEGERARPHLGEVGPDAPDAAARKEWLVHGLGATTWAARLRELHPRRFFVQSWKVLDEEAADERAARPAGEYDYRPIVAMVVGAVCLTLMEFLGHSPHWHAILGFFDPIGRDAPDRLEGWRGAIEPYVESLRDSRFLELSDFVYWSAWRVLGYLLIPALVVRYVWKERVRDHGLSTQGFGEHAWIYVLSYAAVFVGVMFVARFIPHFTEYYPFYGYCSRSWFDLVSWELLYAAQFFSLEFFFRGFWLKAMKPALGSQAIFAMVVPYCMIHFGKPFVEALAAIFAGVVLGTLAMRTRSVWAGCVVHIGVAITMDVTALIVSGRGLPEQWFPG